MNSNYITLGIEPLIFDTYQEFKEWVGENGENPTFRCEGIIGFPNKEEADKFNRVYRIEYRYDNGSVKYYKSHEEVA
jgi:hypothetical protein